MIEPEFQKLANAIQSFLAQDSSGHDFDHAVRVYKTALYLQKKEGGDKSVIATAALVHDICRPWEKKTGKLHFGPEALEIIRSVLISAEVDRNQIPKILDIVALHDIYDWSEKKKNKSLELQIVQDADNLDAMGAMGIARTFAFGGAYGLPLYITDESLQFDHDFSENPQERKSSVAHFYEKLLKLQQNLNTQTGKEIGKKRHDFMLRFLDQFFSEWNSSFE